jgi:hypothetical protein
MCQFVVRAGYRAEIAGMATGRCAPRERLTADQQTSSGSGNISGFPGNKSSPGRIQYPVAKREGFFL